MCALAQTGTCKAESKVEPKISNLRLAYEYETQVQTYHKTAKKSICRNGAIEKSYYTSSRFEND